MTKILSALLTFIIVGQAYACPMCAGSKSNPGSEYLVYILMGFIVLTYIPFFFIYRTIIKNRNSTLPESSESN